MENKKEAAKQKVANASSTDSRPEADKTDDGRAREIVAEGIDENNEGANFEYSLEQEQSLTTNLDPGLQDVLLRVNSGIGIDPAIARESDEGELLVDVIAKLRNPQQPVPGLNIVRTIDDIVTGTVESSRIETVRAHENVISLKGATRLHSELKYSVPEIQATGKQLREKLPNGAPSIDGSGVIVGIIDYGGDFAHQNFRRPDGTTRLLYLWDQNGAQSSMSPTGFPYGREFSSELINEALKSADPYGSLSYNPGQSAHGTHVMDIAAGNGRGSGAPGVAPNADLIFVQIDSGDFGEEESFGNSRKLLEAADYIFTKAKEAGKSAVINMSLGTHGGPHDGSTPAEQGFDKLLKQSPGRAIVLSAGNSWERRSHAQGIINPNQSRTLGWEKFDTDQTSNELEVWYSGNSKLELTLVFPTGHRLGPVTLGATSYITRQGERVGRVIHREKDTNNGDNQINILLGEPLPYGVWGVELKPVGNAPVHFHAWLERDDDSRPNPSTVYRNQSKFVEADSDPSHTIGSISCGRHTITVGSYNAKVTKRDLSSFTAEGPTRDGKQKPEVSAPGHEIYAAASATEKGVTRMSGTSMASPHVTGLVALLMQAAGRMLSVEEIREAVIGSARSNPPASGVWDTRYGFGRVDGVAAVLSQIQPDSSEAQLTTQPTSAEHVMQNGNAPQPSASIDGLLASVLSHAGNARVHVLLDIQIEPLGG